MMCLIMLSDGSYENRGKNPPHQLEFDCKGSISFESGIAIIEGGEIKSSCSGKHIHLPHYV